MEQASPGREVIGSPGRLQVVVISAAMGALALVLPVLFHLLGLGSKFLPMLLPLLLNGFLVPIRWAVFVALMIPWLSALLTGMPPVYPPVVVVVALEGAVLAGMASVLYRALRLGLWPALIIAVISGRLTAYATTWVLARWFGLPSHLASLAMLIEGVPGVVLQLAVVPLTIKLLERRASILLGHDEEAAGAS